MGVAFMAVIVAMDIERELARNARAEELREGGIAHHLLRPALAADMAIEADDTVGLGHHDMEIVADRDTPQPISSRISAIR